MDGRTPSSERRKLKSQGRCVGAVLFGALVLAVGAVAWAVARPGAPEQTGAAETRRLNRAVDAAAEVVEVATAPWSTLLTYREVEETENKWEVGRRSLEAALNAVPTLSGAHPDEVRRLRISAAALEADMKVLLAAAKEKNAAGAAAWDPLVGAQIAFRAAIELRAVADALGRAEAERLFDLERRHREDRREAVWLASLGGFVLVGFAGVVGFFNVRLARKADALRESEEQLRWLFEYAPEAIFSLDTQTGRFLDANRSAAKLFELDREALLQVGPVELSPARQPDGRLSTVAAWEQIRRALDGGTPVFEWVHRSASGRQIPCEIHLARLPGERRPCLRMSVADITERKKVDRLKNEFVSTVSHELRTPITSIRGALGLIAGGVAGPTPPKIKSMIDVAHKNCERLVRLVNDILDMEKIEAGKISFTYRSQELMEILERGVEANRGFAQDRAVDLRFESDLKGARALVDTDRVMQILTNFISNAVKFSPRGQAVVVGAARRDGYLRVSVSDRGPGIPEEFRARIFSKFAQAEGRADSTTRKGTGLGLSIAKALVQKMGGRIGFDRREGGGTTFFFELAEENPPATLGATDRRAPVRGAGRPRVLLVEDNPDHALLVRTVVAPFADLIEAPSLLEAWEIARAEAVDLLILDLALPDGSGLELLPVLNQGDRKPVPVIVFSNHEMAPRFSRQVSASLLKSSTTNEQLAAAVRSQLRLAPAPGRVAAPPGSVL